MGKEMRAQMLDKAGRLPNAVVACVGGGLNAIGCFHPFINDESVEIHRVEAAGHGIEVDKKHCALISFPMTDCKYLTMVGKGWGPTALPMR